MENLAAFLEQLPLDKETFDPVPHEVIEKYATTAPEFILAIWKEYGFCSFGNGFIWMVNPDDLAGIFSGTVWMRTGLAGIFFTQEEEVHYFSPVTLEADGFEELPLEYVINFTLSDKKTLEELYYMHLYNRALKRLGKAGYDECFSFVPAIPMGGDLDAENLQKVKLKEHLYFLTQLM